MSRLRPDILLYYGYEATTSMTLYQPVMFLYFRAVGLSWVQIAALEALGSLTTVLTEVPTGYVGDRVGRLNSLLVGTVLVAGSLFCIALADSFLLLAVVYPAWSLGWNLRSGSDAAWLYDRLAAADQADRFSALRGRARATTRAVGVLCALLGGYLGTRDLTLPFFAAAVLAALGVPALLALRTVDRRYAREHPSPRESAGLVGDALTDRRIGPFVVYHFVLFAGVLAVVFVYAQPVVESLADRAAYDGSVGLLLGVLYAAISLVSAALSYGTGFVAETVGLRRWFAVVPVAVGLGLVGLVFVPILALPAILLARGVADVTRTLAGQYVNDHLEGSGRATVLSSMRMVQKVTSIPFLMVSGWAADAGLTTVEVLALSGLALAVGAVSLGRWTFSRVGPNPGSNPR